MITPYHYRSSAGNPTIGDFLPFLSGSEGWQTTRLNGESPIPIACELSNLIFRMTAPGASASRTFEIQVNGTAVATLTLTEFETELRYTSAISLAADDLVTMEYVSSTGSPASMSGLFTCFEITTNGPHVKKSLYWSRDALFNSVTPRFHGVFDAASSTSNAWSSGTTGATRVCVMPIAGTLVGYYSRLTNGNPRYNGFIGIVKNNTLQDGSGGSVDTRQVWDNTFAVSTTFNRFTEFALPLVVGDRVVFREERTAGSCAGNFCVVFEADTEGESIGSSSCNQPAAASNSDAYNSPMNCEDDVFVNTNDNNVDVIGNISSFAVDRFWAGLTVLPGGGNTRNVGIHLNGADTALTVAITDADNTDVTPIAAKKQDAVNVVNIVDGDRWSYVTSGVSTPAATVINISYRQYIAPAPAILRLSQLVVEVFVDEDEELDEVAECTGGGDVADAENPAEGVSLATTTAPLYWMEVTLNDGSPATVYRWAQMAIPYGLPKEARVLKFGTLTRALSDIDGGFESATITSHLQDIDGVIRAAWVSGALRGARVDYYCADLATLQADGAPDRRFRGYISKCEPAGDRAFSLTVEDALTNRLNAIDGQDLQVPTQLIEDRLADLPTDHESYDRPAPHLFGSISAEFGAWECPFVGKATAPGGDVLLAWFLVSLGVVKVNEAFLAGLGVTADIRVQVATDAFADGKPYVPGKDGWIEANDWSERDSRRWTLVAGPADDPAIMLAMDGTIPLVVNVCGLLADQSLSSSPNGTVSSPALALLLLLNNYFVQDATEDFLPILMDDDVPLFDTESFDVVQAALEAMADSSYEPAIAGAVGGDWTQRSWRDRVAEFCLSFGYDIGINHHGQVILSVLDTTDSSSAFSFTPDQILAGSVRFLTRLPVENEIRYVHTKNYLSPLGLLTPEPERRLPQDTVSADWLSGMQVIRDEASIDALGGSPRGRRRSAVQEYTLSRNAGQSAAVAQRRCDLLSPPNGRIEVAFGLSLKHGCDLELGQVGDAEHWDLPWENTRACRIHRLEEDMDGYVIGVTLRDVDDLRP